MEKRVLHAPFYLIAATFIGLGDTFYLAYYQHLGLTPSCAIGGCEKVLTSIFSKFYGVPLSYIGLTYYVYMLGLVLLLALDPYSKGLRWGVFLYTCIGLLMSLRLESLQILSIGAICMYCAISALTSTTLFALSMWHLRSTRGKTLAL